MIPPFTLPADDGHSRLFCSGSHSERPAFPVGAFSAERLGRLEAFARLFAEVFPRSDQFERFCSYLRGLIETPDRKSVGAMAARMAQPAGSASELAQRLQHFVSKSPWDPNRLLATVRQVTATMFPDPHAVWLVHDVVFPKKGRYSAGAQRQFDRGAGRKRSCQIGIFLTRVGPKGVYPLAARLYLPATWLRHHADAAARTVPESARQTLSRADVALALIHGLRAEGRVPAGVSIEPGSGIADSARDAIQTIGFAVMTNPHAILVVRETLERLCRDLGLDHYEGRSWQGWHHHVGLVLAANLFLATESA